MLKAARNEPQAIKAAILIQQELFENRYGLEKRAAGCFYTFVDENFLPYSKIHKKSCPDDVRQCGMLYKTFGGMSLSEITWFFWLHIGHLEMWQKLLLR